MSRKLLAVAVLTSLCMLLAKAQAQKNEISGLIGRTFISDQGITSGTFSGSKLRSGNGLTLEGNYARRVKTGELLGITVEVPFIVNPDEDYHTPTTAIGNYRALFVTPSARVAVFPNFGVSPWISVGGGFGHFSGHNTILGSKPVDTGNTVGVFQAGLGMDVRILKGIGLRLALRDLWSGTPQLNVNTGKSNQHNIVVAVGPVFHF